MVTSLPNFSNFSRVLSRMVMMEMFSMFTLSAQILQIFSQIIDRWVSLSLVAAALYIRCIIIPIH